MKGKNARLLALLMSMAMLFSLFPMGALAMEGEEEIPEEETTVEEVPVEEAPVEETPVEETPVEETPVEEAPVEETPVEDISAEEAPVEEAPAEEAPVEEIPAEEVPVEETPVEETPEEPTNTVQAVTIVDTGSCGDNLIWMLDSNGVLTVSGSGPMESRPFWNSRKEEICSVVLTSGVTSIGYCAFAGCCNLRSVTIPDTVTSIGVEAFEFCELLTSVTIPYGVKSIADYVFCECDCLSSVSIPDSVTSIGVGAFSECYLLTSVTIPNSVETIGADAFEHSGLKSVTIPDSVTSIGTAAFECCASLKSVTIPNSITSIGDRVFALSALTSVTIPDTVSSIGMRAFYDCPLTTVTLLGDMPAIGEDAFHGVTANVRYPANSSSYTAENMLDFGGTLTWVPVMDPCGENLSWELTSDGVLTITGTGPMSDRPGWNNLKANICTVILSIGVTSIGEDAFYGCHALKSVTIPGSVASIGAGAFESCTALESVTIPSTVKTIGDWAFGFCDALKSVTFLGNMPAIGENSFSSVHATVTFPVGNSSYTAENMLDYGGSLTWDPPLAITAQPAGTTVKAGSKASFSVTAAGGGLSYQWQYRTSASGSWKDSPATGCNTPTLTVSASLSKNGYQYRCKVSAGNKSLNSKAATLSVWGISAQPTDTTAKAGNKASFTVKAQGSVTYQWQYRKAADRSWNNTTATGCDTATLTVSATLAKNGYQYRCKVSCNGKNAYSDPATLSVWGISAQPKDVTAKAAGKVSFTVKAQGSVTYQWQYRKSADRSWTATSASGCNTATLTVSATLAKNGYQYRCKVSCNGKNAYSDPATLTVWGISTQPKNVTAVAGTEITFTVKAQGSGLAYSWQYRKSADSNWTTCSALGSASPTVTIPATLTRNGYQYRCKVTCGRESLLSNEVTLTVKP